jgi:hypothetical protein
MRLILLRHPLSSATLALMTCGVLVLAQAAGASHVRPQGASPLRVPLVPAFKQCTTQNRTHGASLAYPSCAPPVQASSFLTVGTPDANGAGAQSSGFVLLKVKATAPQDLLTTVSISDVRCRPGTGASFCTGANATGGPDYSGQLESNATIRVSDHYNGPNLNEAATLVDIPFPINMPCTNTADTSVGATCSITTCATCIGPPRNDIGGQRSLVEITQFQVSDGGPDGYVSTNDNTLFMKQGIFIP